MVQNAGPGNGLEAWRKLARRYDQATHGRKKNLMIQLLRVERQSYKSLSSYIEAWEERLRQYERRKDRHGIRLQVPDDVKTGLLQSMVPEDLEMHLQLNSSRLDGLGSRRLSTAPSRAFHGSRFS